MSTAKRRWVLNLLLVIVAGSPQLFAAPPDDVMDKARLEKMLADGDTGMIVQVFKRRPGRTLPFIDRYFEGGLAMIEKGDDPEMALGQFRMGIRFAEVADKTFTVQAFSDYANSFASWSPSEQKSFREGQREFKNGAKEQDPAKARPHLERSLALAQSLGDLWGQVMAKTALAELMLKAGEFKAAVAMATEAAQQSSDLRLNEDCAQAFRLAGAAALKTDQPTSSVAYLSQAWAMVESDRDIDSALREGIYNEYLAVLENSDMKQQATALREQHAKSAAARESQTPAPDSN